MNKYPFLILICSFSLLHNDCQSQAEKALDRTSEQLQQARVSRDSVMKPRDLKSALKNQFSKNSTKDGRWVYYEDHAKIEKISKPLVKAIIPNYDFYKVSLVNHLGYHINQATCLVLYDSQTSQTILVEPIWYRGVGEPLLRQFLGKNFGEKESLLKFLQEANELIEIGSIYKFRITGYSDSLITYDLGYVSGDGYSTGDSSASSTIRYNADGVWRKIRIDIRNFSIYRYTSINPKTGDMDTVE